MNFVLCRSFVNRIFGDQKAVLFGSFRLPIFQILGTLRFYFVWWKKLLYQPIYLRPNKNSRWIAFCVVRLGIAFSGNKEQFYSDLSVFQYSKFLGRCIFFLFDEKNWYISQFIYDQKKTHVQLRFLWFVCESDFRGPKSCFIRIYPSSNIPNS
jgi:hypothetical protein